MTEQSAVSSDVLSKAISFVFSWLVLMPVAVIVSGKLLAQVLLLRGATKQLFRIHVPPVLDVSASDDEVILGFSSFIICLLLIGLPAGPIAYAILKTQFGIDPGHFNSLCVLSAFVNVLITFAVTIIIGQIRRTPTDQTALEHERRIEEIARRDKAPGDTDHPGGQNEDNDDASH